MINIRIFDSIGNVSEVGIQTHMKQLTIHNIKQCLQAKFQILGSGLYITAPNYDTLYNDEDVIDTVKPFMLLAFTKNHKGPLGFRPSSARARTPKYVRTVIDYH